MRLAHAGPAPLVIVLELRRLACISNPSSVPRDILNDPDDDCLRTGSPADLIVSGDKYLHGLGGQYQGICIVNADEAVQLISTRYE